MLAIFWLTILIACTPIEPAPPSPEVSDNPDEQELALVVPYDLGETTLLQDHFPEGSQFRNMPERLLGVIDVPVGQGAHPVVLILLGSHAISEKEKEK